jgi:hypothetical protein
MVLNISEQIAAEIAKIPARLKDNFLVLGTINSSEELGPEGVLDQLKDINKYARRLASRKTVKFPELSKGMKDNIRAGKRKAVSPSRKRRAK